MEKKQTTITLTNNNADIKTIGGAYEKLYKNTPECMAKELESLRERNKKQAELITQLYTEIFDAHHVVDERDYEIIELNQKLKALELLVTEKEQYIYMLEKPCQGTETVPEETTAELTPVEKKKRGRHKKEETTPVEVVTEVVPEVVISPVLEEPLQSKRGRGRPKKVVS